MANPQAQRFAQQSTYALQQGELLQALSFIDQSIAHEPENSDSHIIRGVILAQMKQADQATEAFRTAIQFAPNDPKGYYNLAVHLNALGQRDEALELARRAASLDPRHAAAATLSRQLEEEPDFQTPSMSPPVEEGAGYKPNGASMPAAGPPRRHSIRFIESIGAAWYVIGLSIAGVSLFTCVKTWQTILPLVEKVGRNEEQIKAEVQRMVENDPGFSRLVFAGIFALPVLALLWFMLELFDRQGPWWWMIVFVGLGLVGCLCLAPGLPWLTIPAYLVLRLAKRQ